MDGNDNNITGNFGVNLHKSNYIDVRNLNISNLYQSIGTWNNPSYPITYELNDWEDYSQLYSQFPNVWNTSHTVNAVNMTFNGVLGVEKNNITSLTNDLDWYYNTTNDMYYIYYSLSDPNNVDILITNPYARFGDNPVNTNSIGIYLDRCNDTRIYNNSINNVGHAVRVGIQENRGVDVYDNTMFGVGLGLFGGAKSQYEDTISVHHNRIYDTTDWCYTDGIKFFAENEVEVFKGLKIYNNIIGPKISYARHPATAWILVNMGQILEPKIFNNLLIADSQDNAANGIITVFFILGKSVRISFIFMVQSICFPLYQ